MRSSPRLAYVSRTKAIRFREPEYRSSFSQPRPARAPCASARLRTRSHCTNTARASGLVVQYRRLCRCRRALVRRPRRRRGQRRRSGGGGAGGAVVDVSSPNWQATVLEPPQKVPKPAEGSRRIIAPRRSRSIGRRSIRVDGDFEWQTSRAGLRQTASGRHGDAQIAHRRRGRTPPHRRAGRSAAAAPQRLRDASRRAAGTLPSQ